MHQERTVDVVVAGHLCVDLMPRLLEPPALAPGSLAEVGPLTIRGGGCVGNTGLGLAALGASVRLAACVGDDRLGRLLLGLLEQPRVDPAGVRVVSGATSYSIVLQLDGEERCFWHHVGANVEFDPYAVDLGGASVLHVGYPTALSSLQEPEATALVELLRRAQRLGLTTSVDLSTIDAASDAASVDWRRYLAFVLPFVDVLAASRDDLDAALGPSGSTPPERAASLLEMGAAAVLVKDGAGGMHLSTGSARRLGGGGPLVSGWSAGWAGRTFWAPAIESRVASTTGAGDAAVAGLLLGLVRGLDVGGALGTASRAAAARVASLGTGSEWAEFDADLVPSVIEQGNSLDRSVSPA